MKKEEVKCKITIEEGDVIISTNRGLTARYPNHSLIGALSVSLTQTIMRVAADILINKEANDLEFTISYQAQ